jgi:adenylate cyclase
MTGDKVRQLSAVMFTDIVGYTALMQKDEEVATKVRAKHRRIFEEQHILHQGKIIQYYGDGTLSVFKSAIEATQCAVEMQKLLQKGDVVPLRIGLHLGDIVFNDTEVYGDGVNYASRIESLGIAGAILLSDRINDELKNHLSISTVSLGHFELKNITNALEVFAVSNNGIKVPEPLELTTKIPEKDKTIAVLPFLNLSTSQENEYFSDGITEEIINALAKINGLKVTSRTSSFLFKDKSISIKQIGKQLGVSTVLDGSIRLSGDTIRITAQLIQAEEDFHFWSETWDRKLDNIFEIQDEISLIIADKLREHLGHFELNEQLVDSYNVPLETYKKYLKARFYLMKLDYTNTLKAITLFEEVIKESPEFPLPYLDINQGYVYMGTMGIISAYEGFTKAQPFLQKAIELKEDLPETQLNLAWISCWQKRDLKQAYIHLNNALRSRVTDNMYLTMANLLTIEGKLELAFEYCEKSIELAPFSAVNVNYKGFLFYMMGQYDKALPYFKRSLDLQPELPFPVVSIGACYLLSGRQDEGLAYFDGLPEDNTGFLAKLGGTTIAHAIIGNIPKAEEGISKLESFLQTPSAGNALNFLVLCNVQLNNLEKAMAWINEGVKNNFPMVLLLPTEPLAKPLHNLASFKKIIHELIGDSATIEPNRKYKKSLFDNEELIMYKERLVALMEQDELYLDVGLSLRILAEHMNLPANHMSQLLNEGFAQNFADYVNTYRLEDIKIKLENNKSHHLTLIALAYDSGFNSKTVFNTFFKKKVGMTPKEYWNKLNL